MIMFIVISICSSSSCCSSSSSSSSTPRTGATVADLKRAMTAGAPEEYYNWNDYWNLICCTDSATDVTQLMSHLSQWSGLIIVNLRCSGIPVPERPATCFRGEKHITTTNDNITNDHTYNDDTDNSTDNQAKTIILMIIMMIIIMIMIIMKITVTIQIIMTPISITMLTTLVWLMILLIDSTNHVMIDNTNTHNCINNDNDSIM